MAIVLLATTSLLFWIGTVATTCTMCDTDSMRVTVILTAPIYLFAWWLFRRIGNGWGWTAACLLMAFPQLWQLFVAARFTYAVNLKRGCGCWAYSDYPMDSYLPPVGLELWVGPILLATAGVTVVLLVQKVFSAAG